MSNTTDKEEKKKREKTIVKTTEKFRVFSKAFKWVMIVIFSIIGLYIMFLIFGGYIFGSFFVSLIISSIVLYGTITVPTERFVESRIEENFDDEGNSEGVSHIFNEYDIPTDLLKEFRLTGDNQNGQWKSKNGKTRELVENIDFIERKIKYSWFAEFSTWKFMVDKSTLLDLRDTVARSQRDLLRSPEIAIIIQQEIALREQNEMSLNPDGYDSAMEGLTKKLEKTRGRLEE